MKSIALLYDSRGFYWLPAIAGSAMLAVFTDRRVNYAGPRNAGLRRLGVQLGIAATHLVGVRQVHGSGVAVITRLPAAPRGDRPRFVAAKDALVTQLPEVALSVLTADCLPVIVIDHRRGCVAIAHAGWRGLAGGVLRNTVHALRRDLGATPAHLNAFIGPGIRSCCYRVGPEMLRHFRGAMRRRRGNWYVDLVAVAARQLERAGVTRERIFDTQRCSCCDTDFFSYRRGDRQARMLSLVMRAPSPFARAFGPAALRSGATSATAGRTMGKILTEYYKYSSVLEAGAANLFPGGRYEKEAVERPRH
jgi:hypothetical protein